MCNFFFLLLLFTACMYNRRHPVLRTNPHTPLSKKFPISIYVHNLDAWHEGHILRPRHVHNIGIMTSLKHIPRATVLPPPKFNTGSANTAFTSCKNSPLMRCLCTPAYTPHDNRVTSATSTFSQIMASKPARKATRTHS